MLKNGQNGGVVLKRCAPTVDGQIGEGHVSVAGGSVAVGRGKTFAVEYRL